MQLRIENCEIGRVSPVSCTREARRCEEELGRHSPRYAFFTRSSFAKSEAMPWWMTLPVSST